MRNKYEDAPQGVMNWEQALMRQAAGEFNMTVAGRTQPDQTQIQIVDPSHPLAAGLSGVVTVTSAPGTMSFGTGDVVPEPTSLVLCVMGLVGLLIGRRRRR